MADDVRNPISPDQFQCAVEVRNLSIEICWSTVAVGDFTIRSSWVANHSDETCCEVHQMVTYVSLEWNQSASSNAVCQADSCTESSFEIPVAQGNGVVIFSLQLPNERQNRRCKNAITLTRSGHPT